MKKLLQAEEIAQLALTIIALYYTPIHISWWLWPLLFLSPDISMLGYLINTHVGAVAYNLAHHKLVAGMVLGIGWLTQQPLLIMAGLLLWGHSSFDRVMGYGLKYPDSFGHTHLGMIGKGAKGSVNQ